MIRRIGSSYIPSKTTQANQGFAFRGPTGPTGPRGETGNTGLAGNTGLTGIGVYLIQKINSNGITVYLTNNSKINLLGLCGNTATTADSFEALKSKPNIWGTGVTSDPNNKGLHFPSPQTGFTIGFYSFKVSGGLTAYYSGNDIVFSGITTGYSIGITSAVLGSFGNTANILIDASNKSIFDYKEILHGVTTQPIAIAILGNFAQNKNINGITNINLLDLSSGATGLTAWLKNPWDTSVYSFYQKGNTWSNTQIYHSNYIEITGAVKTEKIYSTTSDIFNTSNTTIFGLRKYGSCCYCDGLPSYNCVDYVTERYCDNLNGVFSSSVSCIDRGTNSSSNCGNYGACCFNGRCFDTTLNVCNKFGGVFNSGVDCLENPC